MTPTTALVYWLRGDPALVALVNGRIYQSKLPQSPTYPAVVLTLISAPERYHLRGIAGITPSRVQVDSYAQEASGVDAKYLVDQVAAAVDARLSGRVFVEHAVTFRTVRRTNQIDTFEPAEINAFRVMLEYVVECSQPVATTE